MTQNEEFVRSLARYDTPTICNAIEVAQGKRGFDDYTRGTFQAAMNGAKAMVGYARTAKIAGKNPSTESSEIIKARRLDYFRYMADGPRPALCVVEDIDGPNCVSAWWGEVHTVVHKGLKLSGAITNGVMRDLDDHQDGFPVIAGSIGPSHAFVRVEELECPVEIFGMKVRPGDLVHADQHGALVIPSDILPELQAAIDKLLATEQIIIAPAKQDGFDIEALETAWREFEKSRT